MKPRQWGDPGPLGAVAPWQNFGNGSVSLGGKCGWVNPWNLFSRNVSEETIYRLSQNVGTFHQLLSGCSSRMARVNKAAYQRDFSKMQLLCTIVCTPLESDWDTSRPVLSPVILMYYVVLAACNVSVYMKTRDHLAALRWHYMDLHCVCTRWQWNTGFVNQERPCYIFPNIVLSMVFFCLPLNECEFWSFSWRKNTDWGTWCWGDIGP
jgi:hypothetical protein